jgi:ElaB/YqjD/DUF883 family membrane-anchored ribosome-binding protein
MTSSNIVDASRQNGHGSNSEKTPEEIQLEIARTRTAITEDLLALSEKLSPEHLREGAREVMRDAREEAKEVLREAKDAAIGSLRDVKDRAITSVNDTVSELGVRARKAGGLTVEFVSANAVAISLLGLGAGWLVWALRHRKRLQGDEYSYRYDHYSLPPESYDPGETEGRFGEESQSRLARGEGAVRGVASRASHAVDAAREQVRSTASRVGENTGRLTGRAGRGVRQAAGRTREIASDNRLAIIGLTLAAGLGFGLLLPIGERPRRALRRAGERVWDEAEQLARRGVGAQRRRGFDQGEYDMADLSVLPSGTAY